MINLVEIKSGDFHEIGLEYRKEFYILKSFDCIDSNDYTGQIVDIDDYPPQYLEYLDNYELNYEIKTTDDLIKSEYYSVVINDSLILSRCRRNPNTLREFDFKPMEDSYGNKRFKRVRNIRISEYDFTKINKISRNLIFKKVNNH